MDTLLRAFMRIAWQHLSIEFVEPFFATIYNFYNWYCGVSTPASDDTILYGIEREMWYFNLFWKGFGDIFNVVFSKINNILLASNGPFLQQYMSFVLEREYDNIFSDIFDKRNDILLTPTGGFFTTTNEIVCELLSNVDTTADEIDIENG